MRIEGIETLVCHARMRNWIFVKVRTDQPGLHGWGEATLEWHTRAVVGAIEDLAELIVGEDPRRIEHVWQMMYRQHFWHGNGIVRATAISGIDIALWDIAGKLAGVPCSSLWGGPVRDWVRTYSHLGGGRMEDFYETPVDNARALAETAVAAMRDAVGEGIDIMVDCHARPSPAMGLRFGKALDDFGLYFLEEPCWPECVDGLAMINGALTTPVATGERVVDLASFRDIFEKKTIRRVR